MVKLSEIRAKYPMYDGVSDDQLLIGLRNKHYSDIPMSEFVKSIDYDTQRKDPTEGMSTFDKVAAGFGKSIVDTGRGLGQMVGLVDRKDVSEARKRDAALMETTAGTVGNFAGDVATTLPLAFLPGANTLKGASVIGGLTGLTRPSESTEETLTNTGLGTLFGGGSILAGRGVAAGYQAVTGALRPFTEKGQKQIAAEVLRSSATDANKAALNASRATELVKGSKPTLGQVADDAGLAQLERTLYNNPEAQGPLARAYATQKEARKKAIAEIAGTPDYREGIREARGIFAKEDYGNAFAQGIDRDMAAALQPQIESIMRRPSVKSAQMIAKGLAAERDIALKDFGSLEGMDWVKKALDNQIDAASSGASSIGKVKLDSLKQTRKDLMDVLEQIAPAYKTANDNFAKMSKQVNSMDVADDLQRRLYKNAEWGSGKEMGTTYQTELTKALESVKNQTGQNRPLSSVMPEADIRTLENIARDLSRKEAANDLGKASGSPTMQNMLGQNLLERIAGPMGLPQTFSQNVLANTIARPYGFIAKGAEPQITAFLAEALADPQRAAQLLKLVQQPSKAGLLANKVEKFLPATGLLALE
jgi:hypothetical protein